MQTEAPAHTTADGGIAQPHQELVTLMKQDAARAECLVPAVASFLDERIALNDQAVLPAGCVYVSNITVRGFFDRIAKYSNASPCNYVVGLVYLQRLRVKQRAGEDGAQCKPFLTTETYQRLLLTAIMLASKFLDDFYCSNKHWAQIGGIPVKELNALEADMLHKLGWDLAIQREEYDWFAQELFERAEEEASHTWGVPTPEPRLGASSRHVSYVSGGTVSSSAAASSLSSQSSSRTTSDDNLSALSTPATSSRLLYSKIDQRMPDAASVCYQALGGSLSGVELSGPGANFATVDDGWTERASLVL